MQDLSLHILDIAENSIRANASEIKIEVIEDKKRDRLEIEVLDNGQGMDPPTVEKAVDPFFTTKSVRKIGLGLSLFKEAAKTAGGHFTLQSEPGKGSRVKAVFQHSHIDRKPLGDIAKTLIILILSNPEIRFKFYHRKDGKNYSIDSKQLSGQEKGEVNTLKKRIQLIKQSIRFQ